MFQRFYFWQLKMVGKVYGIKPRLYEYLIPWFGYRWFRGRIEKAAKGDFYYGEAAAQYRPVGLEKYKAR
jgi:hypothetical protein